METPREQSPSRPGATRAVLAVLCLLIAAVYGGFADLKGIGTDEGFRLGIINGGREFTADEPGTTDCAVRMLTCAYCPFTMGRKT